MCASNREKLVARKLETICGDVSDHRPNRDGNQQFAKFWKNRKFRQAGQQYRLPEPIFWPS